MTDPKDTSSLQVSTESLEFSINLYKACTSELSTDNILLSPFSITIALAMTLAGAKNLTANQIINALGFTELNKTDIDKKLSSIMTRLNEAEDVLVHIGNRIYLNDKKVENDFLKILEKHYRSNIGFLDISSDLIKSKNEINQWISDITKGKIVNFVKDLPSLTSVYLASVIYFKGLWKFPFNEKDTHIGTFYPENGKEIKVHMMTQKKHFKYNFNKELKFHILELPYTSEKINMIILLPEDTYGLKSLEKQLNKDIFINAISGMHSQLVELVLPKFKLEQYVSLVSVLSKLGIVNLFHSSNCDLSGISNSKDLYVTDICHKTFMDVSEEGTEASAATGVRITKRSIEFPEECVVNHPFMFFLIDKLSQSVLFVGSVKQLDDVSKLKEEL